MTNATFKKASILLAIFMACAVNMTPLSADEDTGDVMDMVTGDIQSVPVSGLTRVSVTNPEIADISDAQNDKVSLIAKRAGETDLFLWDANGKRSIKIRVAAEDLGALKKRIQRLLSEANVSGVAMDINQDIGKVVLTGQLSKDDKYRLGDIIQPYSDNLLNLVKEEKSEDLIQVDMQIVEISMSEERNLGILWGNPTSTSGSSTTGTQTSPANSGTVGLNYVEHTPTGDKFKDLFKIGNFQRESTLEATVNALIQEGKARLISKPRLVVVSGKQASFLVGGEIPVESTTLSTTGSTLTSNTTYAQYGVNLSVTPQVREGKIDILMNVDIRDIDASNSSNGNTAFITRTATTNLFLDNKQTIVLAGLIKYTDSEQVTRVPFLSNIPIVGALFRNRATPTPDANTEMVIILTPTILTEKKYAHNQLVMPTPGERAAWNEIDSKYEHEPLPPWPVVKATATAPYETNGLLPAVTAYARMVQERISRSITYPEFGGMVLQGTVKLKLHILRDGSLDSEEVVESSGNDILDKDALQAAQAASPYNAFTDGMDQQDLIFTVPIVYNRLSAQGQVPADKVIATY